ncbi:MAG: methyltransferase domain-containing protein [Gemmataceae bacterium]|nr:methyltransferase domain-containing protein [Gemmataceae bacterium]
MKYSRVGAAGLFLGAAVLVVMCQPAEAQKTTRLKILIPESPDKPAKVAVDGREAAGGEGTERSIPAPDLKKGKDAYLVSVTFYPNNYTTITRKRTVKAGPGAITVDLRVANKEFKDDIVVRYVPTPDDIVGEMCKLGKVTRKDIVYDLGCGDGRMVIKAVKDFGARRGVGVDIDPERVKESKENAVKAGVQDKVEFRKGDVLKIDDLSDATVVLLYMGEDINKRLAPILQKSLKPGARVVSHRFTMGDLWTPAKTIRVTGKTGGEYTLLLWVVGEKK